MACTWYLMHFSHENMVFPTINDHLSHFLRKETEDQRWQFLFLKVTILEMPRFKSLTAELYIHGKEPRADGKKQKTEKEILLMDTAPLGENPEFDAFF